MTQMLRHAREKARAGLIYAFEDMSLSVYGLIFIGVVLACALFYELATPSGEGLGSNGKPLLQTSFRECLYFSIVTVSSLGYGDIHPVGLSRAVAAFEVLFGLAFMGVSIARITSRRLSWHVARLFAFDAKRQLNEFSTRLTEAGGQLLAVSKELNRIYAQTPGQTDAGDRQEARVALAHSVETLQLLSEELANYFRAEAKQSHYFTIVPMEPMRRIGRAVGQVLVNLEQLVVVVPIGERGQVFDHDMRRLIRQTVASHEDISVLVESGCEDDETIEHFAVVRDTCGSLGSVYIAEAIEEPTPEQPDQKLESAARAPKMETTEPDANGKDPGA